MEELPLQPNKSTPETQITPPDPEKIGDLLLRYELPASEPIHATKTQAEQSLPKVVISRDKLRDRIGRYKELKFNRTKEAVAETKPAEQLTEVQFERRHEIRDETPSEQTAEAEETIKETSDVAAKSPIPVTPSTPPSVPPPFMPEQPDLNKPLGVTRSSSFKKPLMLGLVAGTLTGIILIILYLR